MAEAADEASEAHDVTVEGEAEAEALAAGHEAEVSEDSEIEADEATGQVAVEGASVAEALAPEVEAEKSELSDESASDAEADNESVTDAGVLVRLMATRLWRMRRPSSLPSRARL